MSRYQRAHRRERVRGGSPPLTGRSAVASSSLDRCPQDAHSACAPSGGAWQLRDGRASSLDRGTSRREPGGAHVPAGSLASIVTGGRARLYTRASRTNIAACANRHSRARTNRAVGRPNELRRRPHGGAPSLTKEALQETTCAPAGGTVGRAAHPSSRELGQSPVLRVEVGLITVCFALIWAPRIRIVRAFNSAGQSHIGVERFERAVWIAFDIVCGGTPSSHRVPVDSRSARP